MIEITRRTALLGALASFFVPTVSLANIAEVETPKTTYINAIGAFPRVSHIPELENPNQISTFFLQNNMSEVEEIVKLAKESNVPEEVYNDLLPKISVKVVKASTEINPNATFSEIDDLLKDVESVNFDHTLPIENLKYIIRIEGNKIARETRRGTGNHIALIDSGLLIWYQGNSTFDVPFHVVKDSEQLIPNGNVTSYFRKINIDFSKIKIEEIKNLLSSLTNALPHFTVVESNV